jgi:hypothetical protein
MLMTDCNCQKTIVYPPIVLLRTISGRFYSYPSGCLRPILSRFYLFFLHLNYIGSKEIHKSRSETARMIVKSLKKWPSKEAFKLLYEKKLLTD